MFRYRARGRGGQVFTGTVSRRNRDLLVGQFGRGLLSGLRRIAFAVLLGPLKA